jgi:hypothetical protein
MLCWVTPRDEVLAELTGLGPPAAGPVDGTVVEADGDDVPHAAAPTTTAATTANARIGMERRPAE